MYESLALYIDGEFIAGGGRRDHDVHNPASREAIGRLPHASTEDLDRALAAAQRASSPVGILVGLRELTLHAAPSARFPYASTPAPLANGGNRPLPVFERGET